MNWLGRLVAELVLPEDRVLDLGCGILAPFGGKRLQCKEHLGIDVFKPYLDRIGPPTVLGELPGALASFADRTFDVVLMLDVLEHLPKAEAVKTLQEAGRIAHRLQIVFTPDGYVPQSAYEAWEMAHNPAQAHLCGFAISELEAVGFRCEVRDTAGPKHECIPGILAVKVCA